MAESEIEKDQSDGEAEPKSTLAYSHWQPLALLASVNKRMHQDLQILFSQAGQEDEHAQHSLS